MSDNYDRKGRGFSLTAVFVILLGLIFLLNNFGVLPWEIWQNLWKFWPVLLILFGIEALIGRKSTPKGLGLLLFLIFLVPIILILNPLTGNPLATKAIELRKPLGNLTTAAFSFNLSSSNLKVDALDEGSGDLFSGRLKYSQLLPQPNFKEERRFGEAKYSLSQADQNKIPFSKNLGNSGSFKFSRLIPLELSFKSATGVFGLNLEKLRINFIEIESKAGAITIGFAKDFSTKAFIKSDASIIKLKIDKSSGATIKTDTPIKKLKIDDKRFVKNNSGNYSSTNYQSALYKIDIELTGSALDIQID